MDSRMARSTHREMVVLVHGLMATTTIMASLAKSLGKVFSGTLNWGYSSLWSPIEQHGHELAALLRRLDREGHERIHLVTHSMGGIIGRIALAEFCPSRFGRFVMIAPPNRGSRVASYLAPVFGRLCPPIYQLADNETSFVCSLPPPCVQDVGIIAAQTDYMVLEEATRLGCEKDYIVVPGQHTSLLFRPETAIQVEHFLQHGSFCRERVANSESVMTTHTVATSNTAGFMVSPPVGVETPG
jgi:pimeloyl-ACP methyl ester carboxylesterase